MCRFLAYSGDAIFLEDLVCKPRHSLVRQSLQASEAKSVTNGDGFGIGWYGERDTPGVYREVMPAWSDDDRLTADPQREISLIYYDNKGGLEDRIFRIRTERSSATSLPEPRTSHNINNVEVIERRGDLVDIRFNWHTMYFRYNTVDPYYGTSFYTIDFSGETPLIRRKTVVLKNDYIHHVVDVYHI